MTKYVNIKSLYWLRRVRQILIQVYWQNAKQEIDIKRRFELRLRVRTHGNLGFVSLPRRQENVF